MVSPSVVPLVIRQRRKQRAPSGLARPKDTATPSYACTMAISDQDIQQYSRLAMSSNDPNCTISNDIYTNGHIC
jgi:hypothetical protein